MELSTKIYQTAGNARSVAEKAKTSNIGFVKFLSFIIEVLCLYRLMFVCIPTAEALPSKTEVLRHSAHVLQQ